MNKVQQLYETCVETFSPIGAAPLPEALQHLQSVLDTIQPIDVGLEDAASAQDDWSSIMNGHRNIIDFSRKSPIIYLHIHECEHFAIGIFCLSPSAVIPLHNHPNMIVLSKLIYGSMQVRAYDWLDPLDNSSNVDFSQARPARLAVDQVLSTPCTPSILYPTFGGNIHTFTAVTPCAVLDVLAPPYSTESGRLCTYFHEVPESEVSEVGDTDDDAVWLEEFQPPDDFSVPRGFYKGPTVVSKPLT